MGSFLVQIGDGGYADLVNDRRYVNRRWSDRTKDRYHGEVQPGDRLLLYCNSFVHNYESTLAFSVKVRGVSADRTTFELGELHRFPNPLSYRDIQERMDRGELNDDF